MLVIDNEVVRQVLTMSDCIDALDSSFRRLATGEAIHRPRVDMYVPTSRDTEYYRWGTMEGADKQLGVFAIRMKSDIISWPTTPDGRQTEEKYCREPGTYCGLVFLFSTESGEPLAMINEGLLQHMRVGAGAGLGTKYLSRPDATRVGMIGSGGMARTYLEAFHAVRPVEHVKVFSPNVEHREEFAREMSEALQISVIPVSSPLEATEGADIVSACTDSIKPVLSGKWLANGMHVTNLNGHDLEADVYQRADVLIKQGEGGLRLQQEDRVQYGRGNSPVAFIAGSAEEMARIPPTPDDRNGFYTQDVKYQSFVDLVTGIAPGRVSEDDVTLYLNGGNQGLQFAAAGAAVYEKAKAGGLGREIPTDWFLQNIRD